MRIVFLGTGASHGIPVIGCNCIVCLSNDPKDKRLRSSVLIETGRNNFIIDAGPDFRQQMLREKVTRIDAVLLTHEHKDHTAGLDDVRAFNFLMKKPMSVYAENRVLDSVKLEYSYVFSDDKYPGIPEMDLHPISNNPFEINGDEIIPVQVFHNLLPVFGFRIENVAYITDAKTIAGNELEKLKNLDILVLNSLRVKPHESHLGLEEALDIIEELKPRKAYLTHMSHMQYSHQKLEELLPTNVHAAYDGHIIEG